MPRFRPLPNRDDLLGLLIYDPVLGVLLWGVGRNRGKRAGFLCRTTGHCFVVTVYGRFEASRVAWMILHGVDPGPHRVVNRSSDPFDLKAVNLSLTHCLRVAADSEHQPDPSVVGQRLPVCVCEHLISDKWS